MYVFTHYLTPALGSSLLPSPITEKAGEAGVLRGKWCGSDPLGAYGRSRPWGAEIEQETAVAQLKSENVNGSVVLVATRYGRASNPLDQERP